MADCFGRRASVVGLRRLFRLSALNLSWRMMLAAQSAVIRLRVPVRSRLLSLTRAMAESLIARFVVNPSRALIVGAAVHGRLSRGANRRFHETFAV